MNRDATATGATQAGLYLADLLRHRYRRRWYRPAQIQRMPKSGLHNGSIARVLAGYLNVHPREGHPEDLFATWKQLETMVSLAVRGQRLTGETLRLFTGAFQITADDAARLWRAYEDPRTILVLADSAAAVPPGTTAALRSRQHRSLFVQDHHYLGSDRLPYRHETIQMIEATVDGYDRYAYAFDTDTATVEVLAGGQLPDPVYSVGDDVYAVDIVLDAPLMRGQRHLLHCETTFHYVSGPPAEFRRALSVPVDAVDCMVTFHPARKPRRAWWTSWQSLKGEIVERDEAPLDEHCTIRRHVRYAENAVFGFTWEW
jgi:hypothetical protein